MTPTPRAAEPAAAEVLVIGETLIDEVERPGAPTSRLPGGSPANVALALGRLGRRTRLATVLADDADGALLRAWLRESGVVVEATAPPSGRTSVARAVLDDHGTASYAFDLDWAPVDPVPGAVDVLHVGSIASVLAPGADRVRDLVAHHRASALISFDPNARPSVTPDREAALARVLELVTLADVVKVSDEDLAWYAPGEDPMAVAAAWARNGPGLVVVTRGGAGASVARASGTVLDVPGEHVTVADTIAAGDTFTAGLLDALIAAGTTGAPAGDRVRALSDEAVIEAARNAGAAAAITVSRPGADPPWREELDRRRG